MRIFKYLAATALALSLTISSPSADSSRNISNDISHASFSILVVSLSVSGYVVYMASNAGEVLKQFSDYVGDAKLPVKLTVEKVQKEGDEIYLHLHKTDAPDGKTIRLGTKNQDALALQRGDIITATGTDFGYTLAQGREIIGFVGDQQRLQSTVHSSRRGSGS